MIQYIIYYKYINIKIHSKFKFSFWATAAVKPSLSNHDSASSRFLDRKADEIRIPNVMTVGSKPWDAQSSLNSSVTLGARSWNRYFYYTEYQHGAPGGCIPNSQILSLSVPTAWIDSNNKLPMPVTMLMLQTGPPWFLSCHLHPESAERALSPWSSRLPSLQQRWRCSWGWCPAGGL